MAYRAHALHLDATTGDTVFDPKTGTRQVGPPVLEKVARWMATPRGRAGRDRTYGIDLSGLDEAGAAAPELLKQRIRGGLKARFGATVEIVGEVEAEAQGQALLWAFTVRDPQDPQGRTRVLSGSL